ncbi:MAG: hypothetical protein GXP40_08430 [Chloroflexi bacterium]|nr:hypothetical protein [Chloroflexota bacterium]
MAILLNPNIAYLLLVGGVLLGFLAIIAPGTGLLEIGAFFCIMLAGYAVYNLPVNVWALIILVLSVVPFVFAIRKPRRGAYLALSILGEVVGSAYMFRGEGFSPAVNPVLVIVVSVLMGGFLWLSITKVLQALHARPAYDLSELVGQIGEAKTDIHEEGSVQVAGELWTARSQLLIPAGARVRVVRREGFVLDVEPVVDHSNE